MLIFEELVNRRSICNTAVKAQFLNRAGISCSSHIILQRRAERKASSFLSLHFFFLLVMLLSRKMREDSETEMDLFPEVQAQAHL